MKIGPEQIITLSYEVREDGPAGELVERMDNYYPFKFLFGTGRLLPAFEARLAGLSEGASFSFTLSPEEAYGKVHDGNIADIPLEVFASSPAYRGVPLYPDLFVSLTDDLGDRHHGKIIELTDTYAKVDFNHALAGKTLYFSGIVLNIRPATVDELIRKHYIAADGVHRS
jgi:FKBP-type peptidyl-prolyl cis-trans isomerase SlyD